MSTDLQGAGASRVELSDQQRLELAGAGERIVDEVPTYRGEGRCFL
ncbi:MAG TPA: hypothetical protein VFP55_02075 [Solirubrobacteraceae bacterium]|nr:hypothetical protein [Solirubrobacteraceae bacterium]